MPQIKRRVLCAEADEDTCSLIRFLLEQQGHEADSASTVRECLKLAAEKHFDLFMLCDDLLDGTSIELCSQLRDLAPTTPILFFSSYAFERDRQRGLDAGASAYLIKPGDILEVVQTVNSILLPRADGTASGQ